MAAIGLLFLLNEIHTRVFVSECNCLLLVKILRDYFLHFVSGMGRFNTQNTALVAVLIAV